MDFFSVVGIIVIIYYLVYLMLLCIVDCDVLLALTELFGKGLSNVRGKVVWITGASSGIGEAMAYEVARHQGKLVLTARREDQLLRVRNKCLELNRALTPEDVLILPLDITKTEDHQMAFDKVIQHFGGINVLVNNAGRSQRAVWENIELPVDRQVFDLNVLSVVSLSRIAVKYFSEKGKGHIAVMSSLAGVIGAPFSGSYTGSKHAIHGYFESLRNEKLGTKLYITLLCPGPVLTNFLAESFTANTNEKFGQDATSGDRRMSAERCAKLCLVAILNRLDEAWMGLFPIIPLIYALIYFPCISRRVAKMIGPRQFQRFRDTRSTVIAAEP